MFEIIDEMHVLAAELDVPVGRVFEYAVRQAYQKFLKSGDTAIDIGAHNGFHLFPMAEKVGNKGKVIAFEPIPQKFKRLNKQIRKRKVSNIVLHPFAVSTGEGMTSFCYFENRPAYSGLQQRDTPFDPVEAGMCQIQVQCKALDRFQPWFRKPSLIKLDIEGGEYDALRSGEKLLAKSRPILIFENGKNHSAVTYGYKKQDFFDLFEKHQYQLFYISGDAFGPDLWEASVRCWEIVALPTSQVHLAEQLPEICRAAMAELQAESVALKKV